MTSAGHSEAALPVVASAELPPPARAARPHPEGGWWARGGHLGLGLRLATLLVEPMPRWLRYLLADIGGEAAYRLLPGRARRARRNYSAFTPGDRAASARLARGAYRNYSRTVMDFLVLERLVVEQRRSAQADSLLTLQQALDGGHGAIVVTPHLGNWDLGAAMIATCGRPAHAITDSFGPPAVDGQVRAVRQRLGVGVIPTGPSSARQALRALRRNEVLCLACDIDKGGAGVPVRFLGQEVFLPGGPALLALRTGAPLIPGYMRRLRGGGHESRLLAPLGQPGRGSAVERVAELTQQIATSFEGMIRQDPAQWFAFHPLTRGAPGRAR